MLNSVLDFIIIFVIAFYWLVAQELSLEEIPGSVDPQLGGESISINEAVQEANGKSVEVLKLKGALLLGLLPRRASKHRLPLSWFRTEYLSLPCREPDGVIYWNN